MTLADYIKHEQITVAEFARILGMEHRQTLHRYVAGRVPPKDVMEKIVAVTGGLVQPNDFFGLTDNQVASEVRSSPLPQSREAAP